MKNKFFFIFIFLMLIYCLSAVCADEINATSQDLTEIDDGNIKVSSLDAEVSSADENCDKLSATDDSNDNLTSDNEHTDISNTIKDHNNKIFAQTENIKVSNINGPKIPDAGIDIHPPKIRPNPTIDITAPKAGEQFLYNLGKKSLDADVVNLNIENNKDLDDLSKYISEKTPTWGLLNITLKPNTEFKINNNGFRDYDHSYKFRYWGSMIINGQGSTISGSNDFMYLTQNANLILKNVRIYGFSTVFNNMGHVFCYDTIFNGNKNVITNYNSAGFETCTFGYDNYNTIEAKEGSFNLMFECVLPVHKESIKCEKNSIMTIYTLTKLDYFKNSFNIDPSASFSIIPSVINKLPVFKVDCSNVDQFKNTLTSLNSYTPNVGRVEINLKSGIYELNNEDIKNINKNSLKTISNAPASLLIGEIPVIINGNGAVIKCTGNYVRNSPYTIKTKNGEIKWDNYKHERFANIAHGGLLIVKNIKFENFDCVFENYGTLYSINCNYTKDNRCNNEVPFLYSSDASNYFYGCALFPNTPKIPVVGVDNNGPKIPLAGIDIHGPKIPNAGINIHEPLFLKQYNFADIFNSQLTIKGCNINFQDTCKIFAQDSVITAPMNLKKSAKLIDTLYYNSNTIVYNNETINPGDIVKININNPSPIVEVEKYLNKINPSKVILNITCTSVLNLDSFKNVENLVILGNGHQITIHNGEINEKMSLTIINTTITGFKYNIFKNKGALTLINCTFTENSGDYLIINEGMCTFINCTISNNKNKRNLMDNKGIVIFMNSTVSKNKYDKDGLIYNHAAVVVINSTFNSNGNVDLYNHNAGNYEIINSSCKTKYVIPEKPKKQSGFLKILPFILIIAGVIIGFTGIGIAFGTLLANLGVAMFVIGVVLFLTGVTLDCAYSPESENFKTGLEKYLSSEQVGDTSPKKLFTENQLMMRFSKICDGKLTKLCTVEKLIQNHNELKSIIKTSTSQWNNEMKVHTFETENNKNIFTWILSKYVPFLPSIISKQ